VDMVTFLDDRNLWAVGEHAGVHMQRAIERGNEVDMRFDWTLSVAKSSIAASSESVLERPDVRATGLDSVGTSIGTLGLIHDLTNGDISLKRDPSENVGTESVGLASSQGHHSTG
jgi:hypothetical protein